MVTKVFHKNTFFVLLVLYPRCTKMVFWFGLIFRFCYLVNITVLSHPKAIYHQQNINEYEHLKTKHVLGLECFWNRKTAMCFGMTPPYCPKYTIYLYLLQPFKTFPTNSLQKDMLAYVISLSNWGFLTFPRAVLTLKKDLAGYFQTLFNISKRMSKSLL